jgi:hypothetical protein
MSRRRRNDNHMLPDDPLRSLEHVLRPDPVRTLTNVALDGIHSSVLRDVVRQLDDKRLFDPAPLRAPRGLTRDANQVVYDDTKRPDYFSPAVRFSDPHLVSKCVRRRERREVLLAKGRGGGGPRKRPRFDRFSDVKC